MKNKIVKNNCMLLIILYASKDDESLLHTNTNKNSTNNIVASVGHLV